MTNCTGLLVGAHFRPPAKAIISCLPVGTSLRLRPEPENPWDSDAIMVLIASADIPTTPELAEALIQFGMEPDELDQQLEWHLGYLAKEGNKELIANVSCRSNAFIGKLLTQANSSGVAVTAKLAFSSNGKALVAVEIME